MKPDLQTWPSLFERLPRVALVCVLAALPNLSVTPGCGPAPDQVELHLFPCDLDGEQPRAVLVEITGYDAAGEVVEVFEVGFDNIDTAVFDDGFATVGYRSDASVVAADIRLGWFSGSSVGTFAEAESVAELVMVDVPAHGEVMALGDGSGDCSEVAGDGDGDDSESAGDGDGDTTQGDGDGESATDTMGDGDGDTSDTSDTVGDGDGDTSTTMGDGDGDPTESGDGDGDPTESGDGDGEPAGPVPMAGDECDMFGTLYCGAYPNGQAGEPLRCEGGTLVPNGNQVAQCEETCGSSTAVDACVGSGWPANCACLPPNPEPCDGAEIGCDGDTVRLCFEGQVIEGFCSNCFENGGFYQCT